jgi:hypothetical protein
MKVTNLPLILEIAVAAAVAAYVFAVFVLGAAQ